MVLENIQGVIRRTDYTITDADMEEVPYVIESIVMRLLK